MLSVCAFVLCVCAIPPATAAAVLNTTDGLIGVTVRDEGQLIICGRPLFLNMVPFIAVLLAACILLVWKLHKTFSYWDGKGIPHVGLLQYAKDVCNMFARPFHEVYESGHKKYGRLYGTYQDTDPCLVVGEPDLLRLIYIKHFSSFADRNTPQESGNVVWDRMLNAIAGEEWKNMRSISTACFTSAKLRATVPRIARVGRRTADVYVELGRRNQTADVHDISLKSTLDAIVAIAFSIEIDSHKDPENAFRKHYYNIFSREVGWRVLMYFRMPKLFKLFHLLGMSLAPERYTENFVALMRTIIEDRIQNNVRMDDQLQVFLDAATNNKDGKARGMTMDEVISQSLLMLVGGSDTTAWTLTSVLHMLALNESSQEKLIEEIDRVIGKEAVSLEKLDSMPYLEAVISEALRLNRINPCHIRQCTAETTLNGIHFTPGMAVNIPINCIHRDPEFFEEPEVFKPERFLPENKDQIRAFTYAPFGLGPRNCIGKRQALLHLKILLVCIFQKVTLRRRVETVERVAFKSWTLLPQLASPIILQPVPR